MKKVITFIIALTSISYPQTQTPVQYIDMEDFVVQAEVVFHVDDSFYIYELNRVSVDGQRTDVLFEEEMFDDNDSANIDFMNEHFDIIHPLTER